MTEILNKGKHRIRQVAIALLLGSVVISVAHAENPPPPSWGLWYYGGSIPPAPTALEECQLAVPTVTGVRVVAPWQDWCIAPNYSEGYAGSVVHAYTCVSGGSLSNDGLSCICQTNTNYFSDVNQCVASTQVAASSSPPSNPSDNGPPCGDGCNKQPTVADPINPGSGNMWRIEADYASGVGSLALNRTYNSSPYTTDATVTGSFGSRWTHSYGAVLKQEALQTQGTSTSTCQQQSNNGFIWCAYPAAPANKAIPDAVSITRSDGKKYLFNKSGNAWIANGNVNDRITATFSVDNTAVTGWTYVSANGDVTEQYDTNGRLLSVVSRSGVIQKLTYSNGLTNDSNAGRIPANAPICPNVQAGDILPAGRLLCVTDSWNRQLQFEYDSKGRITKMIDPVLQATTYAYDGPSGGCPVANTNNRACSANNLTQVTYPGGTYKTYYYNEAGQINSGTACSNTVVVGNGFGPLLNSLTGIVDENGARYATWTYDCSGRATSNFLGTGVAKATLSYSPISNGASTTTVTHYVGDPANPQTTVRQYSYQQILGIAKNLGIDAPCVECGQSKNRIYDANGNVSSRTDFNGNVTTYVYDLSRNLETSRVEASGTTQARTITTSWHPTYRLPIAIAEPLRKTTFNYDGSGNLLSKTIQATTDTNGSQGFSAQTTGTPRTWSYTYNSVGQILTATGPRTDVADVTSYSYDSATGNLLTITNAAGQITTLSNYDANGRVGTITDANGMTTNLSYSPRGWLTSKSVSAAGGGSMQTTTYHYDGVGQLTSVNLPDNSTITYTYDPAHRLADIADSLNNHIHYTLDAMGNRVSEQVNDPSNVLVRQTTRIYDALNRLQQVTGATQ